MQVLPFQQPDGQVWGVRHTPRIHFPPWIVQFLHETPPVPHAVSEFPAKQACPALQPVHCGIGIAVTPVPVTCSGGPIVTTCPGAPVAPGLTVTSWPGAPVGFLVVVGQTHVHQPLPQ